MSYQDPYAPQDVYAQQQQLGNSGAYNPPYTQPGAYTQPPQYGQPGAYPPPPQYGQPGAYPPNYMQAGLRSSNPWANRALYSGVISIVLAVITIVSAYGFAGLITGAFAIYRGITALSVAQRIPGNPGRIQAILAIALGALAWILVLSTLALHGIAGS